MLVRVYPRAWSCHRRKPQVLQLLPASGSDLSWLSVAFGFCMRNILHYNLKQLVFKVITWRYCDSVSWTICAFKKVQNIVNFAKIQQRPKSPWSSSAIYKNILLFGHFLRFSRNFAAKHNLHIKNAANDANDDKGNTIADYIFVLLSIWISIIVFGLDTRFRSHAPHILGATLSLFVRARFKVISVTILLPLNWSLISVTMTLKLAKLSELTQLTVYMAHETVTGGKACWLINL